MPRVDRDPLQWPVSTTTVFKLMHSLMLFTLYKITVSNRVILEKLVVSQLVRKFPAFDRTRRFLS
jgi:hypothetical protein